jgi:hypothetical protein
MNRRYQLQISLISEGWYHAARLRFTSHNRHVWKPSQYCYCLCERFWMTAPCGQWHEHGGSDRACSRCWFAASYRGDAAAHDRNDERKSLSRAGSRAKTAAISTYSPKVPAIKSSNSICVKGLAPTWLAWRSPRSVNTGTPHLQRPAGGRPIGRQDAASPKAVRDPKANFSKTARSSDGTRSPRTCRTRDGGIRGIAARGQVGWRICRLGITDADGGRSKGRSRAKYRRIKRTGRLC